MMTVTFKVMPKEQDVDFEQVMKISKEAVEKMQEAPKVTETNIYEIGFGVKGFKIGILVDEKVGSEKIEEELKKLPEIGDVTVVSMSRTLG